MPCEGKAMRVLERTDQGLIRFLAQNFHGMTEKKNHEKSKAIYSITGPRFEPGIS